MSDRKETPNLLGDILNAKATTRPSTQPNAAPTPQPAAKPETTPRKAAPARTVKPARTEWEYREVIFREFRGWRPRFVDGGELEKWKEQPVIVDYLKAAGADGWEMVGIMENRRNTRSVYFKRLAV